MSDLHTLVSQSRSLNHLHRYYYINKVTYIVTRYMPFVAVYLNNAYVVVQDKVFNKMPASVTSKIPKIDYYFDRIVLTLILDNYLWVMSLSTFKIFVIWPLTFLIKLISFILSPWNTINKFLSRKIKNNNNNNNNNNNKRNRIAATSTTNASATTTGRFGNNNNKNIITPMALANNNNNNDDSMKDDFTTNVLNAKGAPASVGETLDTISVDYKTDIDTSDIKKASSWKTDGQDTTTTTDNDSIDTATNFTTTTTTTTTSVHTDNNNNSNTDTLSLHSDSSNPASTSSPLSIHNSNSNSNSPSPMQDSSNSQRKGNNQRKKNKKKSKR